MTNLFKFISIVDFFFLFQRLFIYFIDIKKDLFSFKMFKYKCFLCFSAHRSIPQLIWHLKLFHNMNKNSFFNVSKVLVVVI